MAGSAPHRRAGRTGSRLANPDRTHPPTGRALRHAAAATDRGSRSPCCPSGGTLEEDGGGMELKPGYKQTEVGVIPEEWDVEPCWRVSKVITVGIVVKPTQYYEKHGVPALRSANIRE